MIGPSPWVLRAGVRDHQIPLPPPSSHVRALKNSSQLKQWTGISSNISSSSRQLTPYTLLLHHHHCRKEMVFFNLPPPLLEAVALSLSGIHSFAAAVYRQSPFMPKGTFLFPAAPPPAFPSKKEDRLLPTQPPPLSAVAYQQKQRKNLPLSQSDNSIDLSQCIY